MTTELSMTHGDRRRFLITITDDQDEPIDVTAGTVVFAAKWARTDEADVFTKHTGAGITNGPGTGQAEVTIDADDLIDVPNAWATLVWDARYYPDDDSGPQTPDYGVLRIRPSVGADPDES